MITENKILNADWDNILTERKKEVIYETYEAVIDKELVYRKTMTNREKSGARSEVSREWYVCDGFWFGSRQHLMYYLRDKHFTPADESIKQRNYRYTAFA